jgi:Ser/Thr protein kinase RdoA (MazF antagonist)
MLSLNSYENRVYQLGIDPDDEQDDGGQSAPLHPSGFIVAKFYRPSRWTDAQIAEEHAFAVDLDEQEIPVVAPLVLQTGGTAHTLHHHKGFRVSLYARKGGRSPETDDSEILVRLGRFLGRIHTVGARTKFKHRPELNWETFGQTPAQFLLANENLPDDIRPAYEGIVNQALTGARAAFERAGNYSKISLHGDVHLGNVLWTDAGPHFVDLDDARTGPALQDLWMLLAGDRETQTRQMSALLEGYEQFKTFDRNELHLLEALRTLRLLHYSAWIAQRWHDPAFPAAFPWFGTQQYWQDRILELREQVGAMSEPVLEV